MSATEQDPFALLESSFRAPNLKSHKSLPRRRDELYSFVPAAVPLKPRAFDDDEETLSIASSHNPTPLALPGALKDQDTGLPPTPPSNSSDENPPASFSAPPHADGVFASLMSKQPSLRTPLNQRSPPTPDPSPPRTSSSRNASTTFLERPPLFAYPSSRAESFKTAREEFSTNGSDSRSETPLADRLSTVSEECVSGRLENFCQGQKKDIVVCRSFRIPLLILENSPLSSTAQRFEGAFESRVR